MCAVRALWLSRMNVLLLHAYNIGLSAMLPPLHRQATVGPLQVHANGFVTVTVPLAVAHASDFESVHHAARATWLYTSLSTTMALALAVTAAATQASRGTRES